MFRVFSISFCSLLLFAVLVVGLALSPFGIYAEVVSGRTSLTQLCEKKEARSDRLGLCLVSWWLNSSEGGQGKETAKDTTRTVKNYLATGGEDKSRSDIELPSEENAVKDKETFDNIAEVHPLFSGPLGPASAGSKEALRQEAPRNLQKPLHWLRSEEEGTGAVPATRAAINSKEKPHTMAESKASFGPSEDDEPEDSAMSEEDNKPAAKKRAAQKNRVFSVDQDDTPTEVERILAGKIEPKK